MKCDKVDLRDVTLIFESLFIQKQVEGRKKCIDNLF